MIMRKGFPSRSVRAVVLTHRSPGTFTQVGPPSFPMLPPGGIFLETLLLGESGNISAGSCPNRFCHNTSFLRSNHNVEDGATMRLH